MNILVAGANGQLGNEVRCVSKTSKDNYLFTDIVELDITDIEKVRLYVNDNDINIIINCAAYTNVDKAEADYEVADLLNNIAVENIATSL